MSILRKPTAAPVPKTNDVRRIATFYASLLVIMAVAQLFTFDDFLALVSSFELIGGTSTAYFLGSLVIALEVFALPFLLRMPLSPAFRWVSMVAGWLVAAIWLKLTIWQLFVSSDIETVGFLGTAITLMPGWWAVFISLSFGILAAWSGWGMWPVKRKK